MGLKKKILNQANKEAQVIIDETNKEKEELLKKLKEKTNNKANKLLTSAEVECNSQIKAKELEFEHEEKRIILQEKNTQIERVLTEFKNKVLNLNDKELFNYVVKLIKGQEVVGNETLKVSKDDYNRYLKLFSTHNESKLVELDKLNNELGKKYKLKLSNEPANIKDGFMLIGKFFDVNFSIEPQLEKIKRDYEREIHNILYNK